MQALNLILMAEVFMVVSLCTVAQLFTMLKRLLWRETHPRTIHKASGVVTTTTLMLETMDSKTSCRCQEASITLTTNTRQAPPVAQALTRESVINEQCLYRPCSAPFQLTLN